MADPNLKPISAAYFYGDILAARARHEPVAQMWERLRGTLATFNPDPANPQYRFPSDIFQQVNGLSANANQTANASRQLMAASAGDAITGDMIGTPFYGRPQSSFEALNQWEARIEMIMDTPAGRASRWVTVQYGSDRPDTVGGLLDDLDMYVTDFATGYEGELVGTGQVYLNQI